MSTKKIYVNGGILVNTRYFACKRVTCFCENAPQDAIYLDPPIIDSPIESKSKERLKCLLIDDDHPQSLFTEYYCKSFFTSLYKGIDYLNMLPEDSFREFSEGINEARDLIDHSSEIDILKNSVFYKMVYLHVVSCIDSYICSMILPILSHDEDMFIRFHDKFLSSSKKNSLMKHLINEDKGKWEQGVIKEILHLSFCDIDRIKESLKILNISYPKDEDRLIGTHFKNRHLLSHRNGKQLSGEKLIIDKIMAEAAINDIYKFGEVIFRLFNG